MNRTLFSFARPARWSILVVLASAGLWSTGCQLIQNPFVDELYPPAVITTPSARAALAAPVERAQSMRSHAAIEVRAKDGSVTHGPLLFEGPFEAARRDDTQFAWTRVDSLAWVCGTGRFLTNIALYPVSAVATPPWSVMVSDGEPSRSVPGAEAHDAAPLTEPASETKEAAKPSGS